MASVEFQIDLLREEVKDLRRELDAIHAQERAKSAAMVARSMRAFQFVVALYVVGLPVAAVLLRG